ncbi:MAG TPA: FixG Ig-like domain-containing protein, partial [Puia sp.]|nr:FixG Ig-like domain-containing protein [Puia sp.]
KLYTGLLSVLVVMLGMLLWSRKDVDATVMRAPGMLFQERGNDSLSNLYIIKVANKTVRPVPLRVRLEGMAGQVEIIGGTTIPVKREEEGSGTFFVVLPRQAIELRKTSIRLGLYEGNKKIDEVRTNFVGPVPGNGD